MAAQAKTAATETVEIRSWLTGAVLFSAAIDVSVAPGLRIRAAVELAVASGASLVGACLDGASLVDARLVGASLVDARLDGANLIGASLDRARLDRASLIGASIGDTKVKNIVARVTRSDGYEFMTWQTEAGEILITAGCRTMHGTDAYREHVKSYSRRENGTALAAETLAILDYIDARAKAVL